MTTTRRNRNENFFKWEPVEGGNARFTPNAPLNWFYEIVELSEASFEEEPPPTIDTRYERDLVFTEEEIQRMTPTNDELLRTAQMFPPPPEWFEGDEDDLF